MQQQQQKKFRPNSTTRGNFLNVSFGEANLPRSNTSGFNTTSRPPMAIYGANMPPQVMVSAPNQHQFQANESNLAANTNLVSFDLSINSNTNEGFPFVPPPPPQNKRVFENEDKNEQLASNERAPFDTTNGADLRVFTGTVEKVIKWNKLYDASKCFYEVIACVISMQDGQKRMQKILLLRDSKGPVLQVVFYTCDRFGGENFHVGQMLRCVGSMIGPNSLRAFSIRLAKSEEIATLQRFYYISDHAVMRAVSNN